VLRLDRVYGLENEYQVTTRSKQYPHEVESYSRFRHALNTGRLYTDVGPLLEYATPVCASVEEAVVYDIAGEYIALDALNFAMQRENEKRRSADPQSELDEVLHFSKRANDVRDRLHLACGIHDNYLTRRWLNPALPQVSGPLALQNVTRNIYVGGGRYDSKQRAWVPSQKAPSITDFMSIHTTHIKPVVNLRDEPLADPERYRRFHNTYGDATISPWATRLKLGATSVILYMLEAGEDLSDLSLDEKSWYEANTIAGSDPTLKRPIRLANGKTIRPLDAQMEFAMRGKAFSKRHPLPLELIRIIDVWLEAGADAEQDPQKLERKSDWVAKRKVADSKRAKDPWKDEVNQMRTIDLEYTNVGPVHGTDMATGTGFFLRDRGYFDWSPSKEAIEHAIHFPPERTTAHMLGKFLRVIAEADRRLPGKPWPAWVGWGYIDVKIGETWRHFSQSNPRKTNYPGLEEVIAGIEDGSIPKPKYSERPFSWE